MSEDTSKFALKDSLCWHCSRATDGSCSWSEKLIPVDGWSARYTENHRTFTVMDCPLFARYESDMTDDTGYRKLIDAEMARAGQDYMHLLRHEKKLRDKDPALFTKRAVYGDWRYRNKETTFYKKPLSDTWKVLYNVEPFNTEITSIERFFMSEYAEMFGENINPVYIMETIQKQVGIRHESI